MEITMNHRHAYLIMVSNNYNELFTLLSMLDYEYNDIYIHIDLKDTNPPFNYLKHVCKKAKVFLTNRIAVTWGGSSQICCELLLLKAATSNNHYDYYHLLSGQDFPIYSQEYIHYFFEKNYGINFITPPKTNHDENKVRMRYEQYHFLQNKLIGKKRNFFKYIDFASCYLQKFVGIKRFKKQHMAMSSNWFSITDDLARFYVKKEAEITSKYRFTYCCDEIFILSEIIDTSFFDTLFSNGNLRFIKWKQYSKRDTSPKILTISDLDDIVNSKCIFARKMHIPESSELLKTLTTI